jgi:putative ATPase
MDLFGEPSKGKGASRPPLADRVRPQTLGDFVGQEHLVGEGRVLRRIIEGDDPASMIFWGPPGVGKTTLARIIAHETQAEFFAISAVTAGLADVRKIIAQAKANRKGLDKRTILFIDEIHRFNKAQQDALLHSVEDGTIVLIGATTENPSFEVIAPLLSRCRVYQLEPLEDSDIQTILQRALASDSILIQSNLEMSDDVKTALVELSGGDARVALNGLELCGRLTPMEDGKRRVTLEVVKEAMQKQTLIYDKKGDFHYDTISAFIKSMRGSDPDAAVYWMARMLEAGEDPLFIARRMVILASEDVGNADPQALVVANAAFQAVHAVGLPEARIILSQAATYLASAPKSNAAYLAINEAQEDVRKGRPEPVPMHLRNAPTRLMADMGYAQGYKYAHNFEGGFAGQEHLPPRLKDRVYYRPKDIGHEKTIKERLEGWWPKRRKKKDNEKSKGDT